MISQAEEAIPIGFNRYDSFPNMLHTHISISHGNGKKSVLISKEEPASVRSCDDGRTSSSFTPNRRIVKDYSSLSALQSTCIPQLDHKISLVHSSPTMDDVSANFPNYIRTDLGDQGSSPPQDLECQENMKQQINIKGRKESIPSLHPIPNVRHSVTVKASSKFEKMGSLKSLQTVMDSQIYNRNTRISASEDRNQENSSTRSLGLYNQNMASPENSDMDGSLNLLVDAIQLLECRELPTTIGLQTQKNVSIKVLPKKLRRTKIALSKPSLQNPQCLVEDHGLESAKKLSFSEVSQSGEGQLSFNGISKVGEIEQGIMTRTCSKRGRLQAFPSKYSDSVLQPWKKVSRKVPSFEYS